MFSKLEKLSNTYNPKKKKNYNQQEIDEKLKGYVLIDDINDIPINTHIRYFKISEDEKLFRTGGFLKDKNKDYIMLTNGKHIWSVQLEGNELWKKMNNNDIIEGYELKIKNYENLIKKLNKKIEKLEIKN